MHKYLLYAFSHSNVSAAFSCISRGATARKRFTLSLMDLLSSRVMEVIFEIIRRSINLLCVLSLKLKSLRIRSLRGYSWSTWIRKTLKMGYKHGVFFPLLRCGPWYGEMHLENTSEPKVTLPEAVFGEAAEQDGQVTRTGIRQSYCSHCGITAQPLLALTAAALCHHHNSQISPLLPPYFQGRAEKCGFLKYIIHLPMNMWWAQGALSITWDAAVGRRTHIWAEGPRQVAARSSGLVALSLLPCVQAVGRRTSGSEKNHDSNCFSPLISAFYFFQLPGFIAFVCLSLSNWAGESDFLPEFGLRDKLNFSLFIIKAVVIIWTLWGNHIAFQKSVKRQERWWEVRRHYFP